MVLKAALFHLQLIFVSNIWRPILILKTMRTCVINRCGAHTTLASFSQGV